MPSIEYQCLTCGHLFTVVRPLGEVGVGYTPACQKCGDMTRRVYSTFTFIVK